MTEQGNYCEWCGCLMDCPPRYVRRVRGSIAVCICCYVKNNLTAGEIRCESELQSTKKVGS